MPSSDAAAQPRSENHPPPSGPARASPTGEGAAPLLDDRLSESLPAHTWRRRLPAPWRAAILTAGVAATTGLSVLTGASLGLPVREAVILSLPAGLIVGVLMSSLLILIPERSAAADRRWLIECLSRISRVDREQRFSALLSAGKGHELAELARAVHASLLSAHRDRLEAAQLRRELDARVQRQTKAVVAQWSKISLTDELTGLNNRRGFDQAFQDLFESTSRRGEELALLAIDLDHFKQLNDTCGHDVGDRALRAAGELLLAQLREGDLAARLGGDEMVIALRGTGSDQAGSVAERLIALFARHPAALGVPARWPTFSIGIACAGEHHSASADHLRRQADEALYAAKRAGRCVARIYGEPEARPAASAA